MIRRPPRSTLFPYRRSSDLNLRNALAFPLAASDKAGTAWLYYGTDPVRNSLGKDPCCESGGEQVATESLDNILNQDRKSTRLNSSHGYISYAVFCLKKKNTT